MTAMSAQSASETPSPANPFLRDLVASLRTVVVPGSPATFANRAALRERLGLEVRLFGTLEPPRGPSLPRPSAPTVTTVRAVTSIRDPAPRPRDGSRTHAEARTAYRAGEDMVANSRFSERDITSGLPDDSREEDERQEERRLREVRARVRAARAVVATTPGLAEILKNNWRRAAMFYAKHGTTEEIFEQGIPASVRAGGSASEGLREVTTSGKRKTIDRV
jgi:hypothetical protein